MSELVHKLDRHLVYDTSTNGGASRRQISGPLERLEGHLATVSATAGGACR